MSVTLYAWGVGHGVTTEDLMAVFSSFGKVESLHYKPVVRKDGKFRCSVTPLTLKLILLSRSHVRIRLPPVGEHAD